MCRCRENCEETFWLNCPNCLLSDFRIIPTEDMTLEEKINTITRLVIIVFVIMLILKYKYAIHFLIIALVLLIIAYYSTKHSKRNHKEAEHKNKRNYVEHPRFKVKAGNGGDSSESAEENEGDGEFEVTAEGLELLNKQAVNPKPASGRTNPRRPWPNMMPSDLEVKAEHKDMVNETNNLPENERTENNYLVYTGRSVSFSKVDRINAESNIDNKIPIEIPIVTTKRAVKKKFQTKNGSEQESTYVERAEHMHPDPHEPQTRVT